MMRLMDRCLLTFVDRFALRGRPNAKSHFRHYLAGSGTTRMIDTSEILEADPGLQRVIAQTVLAAPQQPSGSHAISQLHYANRDWCFAVGGFTLMWSRIGESVNIEINSRYAWQPHTRRISRLLHATAHRCLDAGAAEFEIVGRPCRLGLAQLHRALDINTPMRKFYI